MTAISLAKPARQWKTRPVGEVFEIIGGGTPSKQKASYYGGDIPWATIRDMRSDVLSETEHTITEEGLRASSAKVIPGGEVIMASRVGLGKACLLKQDTAINQDIRALLPRQSEEVDRQFCLYWLQSVEETIIAAGTGATVQGIKLPFIKTLPFPDISLEEQKRIVAVLDRAFAALDRARALAQANLADAEELFGAAVDAVIHRLANGREQQLRLGSIVTRLTNGYVGPIRDIYIEKGIPYLLARHVRDNQLTFDGKTFVSEEFNEKHKKSKLKVDDVLLVQSGHIGHSAVVPPAHAGHNCHAMIVLTTIKEVLSGEYLSAIFNTPKMQDRFQEIRTGSTVPHLTCKMVKELKIAVPPVAVQKEVLKEIRELQRQTSLMRRRYQNDLNDLDDLRQSALKKAFAGELT